MGSLKALIAPKMEVSALNMTNLLSCSLEVPIEEKVFMLLGHIPFQSKK